MMTSFAPRPTRGCVGLRTQTSRCPPSSSVVWASAWASTAALPARAPPSSESRMRSCNAGYLTSRSAAFFLLDRRSALVVVERAFAASDAAAAR